MTPEYDLQALRIAEQAWQHATADAQAIAEDWLRRGGDIMLRARRFTARESLKTAFCERYSAGMLARRFRLLAVLLYLGGEDLTDETLGYRAVILLYATHGLENGINPAAIQDACRNLSRQRGGLSVRQRMRLYRQTRRLGQLLCLWLTETRFLQNVTAAKIRRYK